MYQIQGYTLQLTPLEFPGLSSLSYLSMRPSHIIRLQIVVLSKIIYVEVLEWNIIRNLKSTTLFLVFVTSFFYPVQINLYNTSIRITDE